MGQCHFIKQEPWGPKEEVLNLAWGSERKLHRKGKIRVQA